MGDLDVHLDRLEESPDDAQALSAVEEIYSQENRLGELASLYDSLACRVEPAMAANLWLRGARLFIDSLQQPVQAEPYLKKLFTPITDPSLGYFTRVVFKPRRRDRIGRTLRERASVP